MAHALESSAEYDCQRTCIDVTLLAMKTTPQFPFLMMACALLGLLPCAFSQISAVNITPTASTTPAAPLITQERLNQIRVVCHVNDAEKKELFKPLADAYRCIQRQKRSARPDSVPSSLIKKGTDALTAAIEAELTAEINPKPSKEVKTSTLVSVEPDRDTKPPITGETGRNPLDATPTSLPVPHNGSDAQASHYGTSTACSTSIKKAQATVTFPGLVRVRRYLLAPKEASDIFGYRLGRRYFVYQVRVTNNSPDFQYVVQDISVDLTEVFGQMGIHNPDDTDQRFLASGRELNILRGVPEKGMDFDPRYLTLHIFQGVGNVGGAVSSMTPFSSVMGSAMAAFSGPFIQSFTGIAPDHTATQLNRLSDIAFQSNTLIDKMHTKVFAVFIPEDLLLSAQEQKMFWRKTRDLLNQYSFDQVDVCVDGTMVTPATITNLPAISPATDTLGLSNQTITLSVSGEANPDIYYTTNGSTPTKSSTKYPSAGFALKGSVGDTLTVQAIAIAPNKVQSTVAFRNYTIVPDAPKIVPDSSTPPNYTITGAAGATIKYTTDGTDPSLPTATKYDAQFALAGVTAAKPIKAIAIVKSVSSAVAVYPPATQ